MNAIEILIEKRNELIKQFDKMAKETVLSNLLSHWGYLRVEMANAMENDTNEDAAEKVLSEVRGNANRTDMGFSDAEVVPNKEQQPAAATPF